MTVSVIIPTYNRENTIKESITSVLNQTYEVLEIIVVDDFSTDNTEKIVKEITSDKIIYTKNKNKKGANGARNTGIDMARGNYIAFQDSDDVWEISKIQKQMKVMLGNKEVDLCFCSFNTGTQRGIVPARQVNMTEIKDLLFYRNFISTQTILLKADIAKENKFNESLKRLQDWELVLRLSNKYIMYHLNENLVSANFQENSISLKENLILAVEEVIKIHPEFKYKNNYSKKTYYNMKFKKSFIEKKYLHSFKYVIPFVFYQVITRFKKQVKV